MLVCHAVSMADDANVQTTADVLPDAFPRPREGACRERGAMLRRILRPGAVMIAAATMTLAACTSGASSDGASSAQSSAVGASAGPSTGTTPMPSAPAESASPNGSGTQAGDVVVPPPGPAKTVWESGTGERHGVCTSEQLQLLPSDFAVPSATDPGRWSGPYCDEMEGETLFVWAVAEPGDTTTTATDAMAALKSSMIDAGWQSVENTAEDRPQGTVISEVFTTSSGDSQALVAVWSDGRTPATLTLSSSAYPDSGG